MNVLEETKMMNVLMKRWCVLVKNGIVVKTKMICVLGKKGEYSCENMLSIFVKKIVSVYVKTKMVSVLLKTKIVSVLLKTKMVSVLLKTKMVSVLEKNTNRWTGGKTSASRCVDQGSSPAFPVGILIGCITSNLPTGTLVGTLPETWHYRVSARTGWSCVFTATGVREEV